MTEPALPPNGNKGLAVLAISWATVALAIVAVSLRLYIRLSQSTQVGTDDAAIVVATALSLFGSVGNTYQTRNGLGRHIKYLDEAQIYEVTKWTTAVEIETFLSLFLIRFSVCFFLLRIVSGSQKWWFRTVLYLTIVINILLTIVIVICYVVQCIPFKGIWDQKIKAKCIPKPILYDLVDMFGACSIVTDFICALLPFFILCQLHLDLKTKRSLCIVLSLGVLTATASIGKVISATYVTSDFTHDILQVQIWSIFEQNLGITIASLPSLRNLFKSLHKTLRSRPVNQRTSKVTKGFNALDSKGIFKSARSRTTFPDEQETEDNMVPMGQIRKTTNIEVTVSGDLELERGTEFDDQPHKAAA